MREALFLLLALAAAPVLAASDARFPSVTGKNLEGAEVQLPSYFAGRVNVVLVAFQRWHQEQVDTWIGPLRSMIARNSGLKVYEIPVLPPMNWAMRTIIDNGMASGIDDPQQRADTVTLYTDTAVFRSALAIPDEENIRVMLLDREGRVLHQTVGPYVAESGGELERAVRAALGS